MNAQNEVIESLKAAPAYVNPAIELAVEVQQLELRGYREDLEKLLRGPHVETAIVAGEKEGRAVMHALAMCAQAPPVASKTVPVGF
jgi:hypothetical protein